MCITPRSQNFSLSKYIFFLQIFSYMVELFTSNRICPNCPFKGTQRVVKMLVLYSSWWLGDVAAPLIFYYRKMRYNIGWHVQMKRTKTVIWWKCNNKWKGYTKYSRMAISYGHKNEQKQTRQQLGLCNSYNSMWKSIEVYALSK